AWTNVGEIYAQRASASGIQQWADALVCNATGTQDEPQLAPSGLGGAIVTWRDFRTGSAADIYAQRVNATGTTMWAANGVVVCRLTAAQGEERITSEGDGGAIIAWTDARSGTTADIYAQRMDIDGVPQWTANGVPLCTANNGQVNISIASDGSGGAIAAWEDPRSSVSFPDIYAQRIDGIPPPCDPVRLVGLEINQCIQDLFNSVLLVDGNKTFVRADLEPLSGSEAEAEVRLRGVQSGVELPGSPLTPVNPDGRVQVLPGAVAARGSWLRSANFRLPDSWTHGTVTFQVV